MSHMTGLASADRISILSGASYRPSIAPSMMMHDYNGKKQKIIQTCRQIDDMKSGVVKAVVFSNLLSCLDVEVERADFVECLRLHGIIFEGVRYIKYDPVVRLLYYDNHNESWNLRSTKEDIDTLSVIQEGKRARVGLNTLRASYETIQTKQRDQPVRTSLQNKNVTLLSTDALRNFEKRRDTIATQFEDEEAV